ncbi:MAG: hypothetical protein WDA75_09970 [Candidatus Latescibacterota bacterium]
MRLTKQGLADGKRIQLAPLQRRPAIGHMKDAETRLQSCSDPAKVRSARESDVFVEWLSQNDFGANCQITDFFPLIQ